MTAEERTEIESVIDQYARGYIGEVERDEAINAIAGRGRALTLLLDEDAA